MTPQTALAEEQSAIPPVIVKSGGDPHVHITSESIRFAENVAGPTWSASQSTQTGRIRKVKIKVGEDTAELPVTPTSQLASVTFDFGRAQLIAMESGPTDAAVLQLVSPEVQFTAASPVGVVPITDWSSSDTEFQHNIRRVTVMAGEQQLLSSEFQTEDVTVAIYFN